jgi:hypothetical protein
MSKKRSERTAEIVVRILACLSVLVGFTGSYLWYSYAATRPAVANPAEGRVYSLITHGREVYLTGAEEFRLQFLLVLGVVGLMIAGAIHLRFVNRK